ncbi:MAG: O-methyltransferase [Tuberibacillus sp.]
MDWVEWRDYTNRLNCKESEDMRELTEQARSSGIPIMQSEAMALVEQIIRVKGTRRILEIGTAIGWSAINMARAGGRQTMISTVEREPKMVEAAKKNIRHFQLEEQIEVLHGDVLEIAPIVDKRAPFDMIFIDAGKGHYKEYFSRFMTLLSPNGMIICDNVYFRGFVMDPEEAPKRLKRLAKKMHEFNQWLSECKEFETVFVPIGDGLSISIRKNDGTR